MSEATASEEPSEEQAAMERTIGAFDASVDDWPIVAPPDDRSESAFGDWIDSELEKF